MNDTVLTTKTGEQTAIDVSVGALDHFTVTGVTDPTDTDADETPVVTAYDADNNVKTDYVGTITFTSDDGSATLPADYTYLVGDAGVKTFTNGVNFASVGSFYVRVNDTVLTTKTGEQSAIDVGVGALDHFTVASINDPTDTDTDESPVVTAYDADNNVKTDYVGTITFTSDDGSATLPADYTYLVGDAGVRTFTNGVNFAGVGSFYVRVNDTVLTTKTGEQTAIDVSVGALDHFTVASITDPTDTDTDESPVVTAYDADNNVKTDYVGTITFTSDDGSATLPPDYTYLVGDAGVKTFTNGVNFATTGSFYVRVNDTVLTTKTGEQSAIDVNPGALDHFTVASITDPTDTDTDESPVVTAYDADNNVKTDYVGTITFTSDDGSATLPADYTYLVGDAGVKTFTNGVNFAGVGSFYVRVNDTVLTTKTGEQTAIDVSVGALDHFTVASITDPTDTDTDESPVVTAYDADNNVKTDYVGTITFTSDDGSATLPADYTFLVGDAGVKTFTNGVNFASVGSFYVRVNDTVLTTKTGEQSAIDVNVGALDHFTVASITDPTDTDTDESPVVTAYDADNNVKTDYVGTITFTSDDGSATLPADYTYLVGDAGVKTFTNGVNFDTTGSFYVRVNDTVLTTKTGEQTAIDVNPGALDHFTVASITDPTDTDTDESPVVTAYDADNNVKTDYVGTITFTSDDGSATLPADYTYLVGDAGVKTFTNGVNFAGVGSFYVRVNDTVLTTKTGEQPAIDVNVGALDHFTVTSITDPTDTDTDESPVVTAYDADNNIKTDYVGTITFTSDDGSATLPADYTYLVGDAGVKTFTNGVNFDTTGSFYVRVNDTVLTTKTGEQTAIDVNPGALDHFTVVSITDPTDTDTDESPVVTAYDADNNVKTDYVGTITFTSDDGSATLPADYTYLVGDAGVKTFTNGVNFASVGSFYVRVNDTVLTTKTGEQTAIDVSVGALDHFTVTGITDPTDTDSDETPVVTAYDADNNVKTDYVGTITFTSDDGSATLPADYTYLVGDAGVKTFTNGVNFASVGSFYVRVNDTVLTTKTGEQSAIDVSVGALDHFGVTAVNDPTDVDTDESPVVTAYDSDNNVKTDYVGTITFTSDDGSATLPADYTYLVGDAGVKTFTNGVRFQTTGSFYLRVNDTVLTTKTGEQSAIDVNPGALDNFLVTGITDPTITGAAETATITARDQFNNTKTDYVGTITFTSDDGAAVLPADYTYLVGDAGVKTFTSAIQLRTTGSFYVRVNDTVLTTKTGEQSAIDVGPSALESYTVTGISDPTVAGTQETPVVTAYDAYSNVKTDYVGTATFTSDDGAAVLPADYAYLVGDAGVKTFTNGVEMRTTGDYYVRVNDTVLTTKTGEQSAITVNPDALDHFVVSGISDPTDTDTAENVTVEAQDQFNNTKTDYVGTITFTSDDGSATLPADYTYLVGDAGVKTFTSGVQMQTTGDYYVRVNDTVLTTKTGEQSAITVNPGALDYFTVVSIADPVVAGTQESPVVTAYDAANNVKTDYVGTVTFTTDDGAAGLPGDYTYLVGDAGVKTFTNGVELKTVGSWYVRVNDTVLTTKTGEQTAIDVTHAPASQIVYTTQPGDPLDPGADILVDLEIRDPYDNVVTTGDDATASVTLTLQAGTGTINGTTVKAASGGTVSFTATEAVYVDIYGAGKVVRATKADTTPSGTPAVNVDSNAFTITQPSAPTGIVLKDPATSPSNDTTPEVTVSGIINGNTIKVYTDSACSSPVVGSAVAGGTSVDVTASPALGEANYTFWANQTDTYTNVSPCSAASVAYNLDLTNPDPATSATLASGFTTSPLTSPLFSWTASGSGDVDHYEVALGTTSGGEEVVTYTTSDTSTTHTFTGLSLTECSGSSPVYWPSVKVIDTAGNESTVATHATGFLYDNTAPSVDPAITNQLNDSTSTKAATITWSSGSDNCGIDHFELSIGTSAGATDVLNWVDVGAVNTYQLEDGVDGSFTLSNGTYYYVNLKSVDNVNLESSVISSNAFRFLVPPDAITDLAYAGRSSTTIDLSWTEPNDNGALITDYYVYYRVNGCSCAYTPFNDGISSNNSVTVTGLTASTTYDFIVRAYNGGTSADSNTLAQATAPNDPFFDPATFSAMNPGATAATVVALEDDTEIFLDSISQGTIDSGQVINISGLSGGELMDSDKPFYVAGRLQGGGTSNTQVGHLTWMSPDWSGTDFLFVGTRSAQHVITIYPFENGTLDLTSGGTIENGDYDGPSWGGCGSPPCTNINLDDVTLTNGSAITLRVDSNKAYEITSTATITAFQWSEGGGNDRIEDNMPILPPALDIIGVPSRTGYYTSDTNTTASWYESNNTQNIGFSITAGVYSAFGGNGAQYSAPGARVIAGGTYKLIGRSTADNDGNDSSPFVPKSMMRKRFAINHLAEWVTLVSDKPVTIQRFSGGTHTEFTLTQTAGSHANAPYFTQQLAVPQGTIYESNEAFQVWYETDTAAETYNEREDETVLFGTNGPGLPVHKDLKLWLDASDSDTLFQQDDCTSVVSSNGESVGCWRDKSYFGNNVTQATADNKPMWNSTVDGFAGAPGVDFDGVDDVLGFDETILNGTNYTIFAVVHRDGAVADNYFIGTNSASANAGLHFGFSSGTQVRGSQVGNDANVTVAAQTGASVGLMWMRLSSAGKDVSFNGATGNNANTTQISSAGSGVIGRGNQTADFDGQIAELIIFTRDLNATEVTLMEDYLREKWLRPTLITETRLWLDSSDKSNIFSDTGCSTEIAGTGNNALCWRDRSGNGYLAKQSAGTVQYVANGGHDVLHFTNDSLAIEGNPAGAVFANSSTVDEVDIFAFMKSTNSSEDGYLINHQSGNDLICQVPDNSSNVSFDMSAGAAGSISAAWGGNTTNYFRWNFMSDANAGAQEIWRDNTSVTSDSDASSLTIGTEDFYIGSDGGTKYQNMHIGSLIIFEKKLTTGERHMIRAYLDSKWQ